MEEVAGCCRVFYGETIVAADHEWMNC